MLIFNLYQCMPKWRNGRRTGLKIPRGQPRKGSTPFFGTSKNSDKMGLAAVFGIFVPKTVFLFFLYKNGVKNGVKIDTINYYII